MNLPETFEPPLSPAPLGGLRRAPVAAGAGAGGESTGPTDPPLPNRLLRMGLVTLPQLTAAMQQQAETGLELTDVLIRSGIIGVDDLARLDDESAPQPAPAPAPAPDPKPLPPAAVEVESHVAAAPVAVAPVAAPTPVQAAPLAAVPAEPVLVEAAPAEPVPPESAPVAVAPVAEPAPVSAAPVGAPIRFAVVAQLEGGARFELGTYDDDTTAREGATEAMRAFRDAGGDWPLIGGRYVRPDSVVAIEVSALL